jgi:hypothetical protein
VWLFDGDDKGRRGGKKWKRIGAVLIQFDSTGHGSKVRVEIFGPQPMFSGVQPFNLIT